MILETITVGGGMKAWREAGLAVGK